MENIFENIFLGSFAEVQEIKLGKMPSCGACLSIGSEFILADVSVIGLEDISDIILPDLNLIGIKHLQLSLVDGEDNVICKILPGALTFIDDNFRHSVYTHCFAGVSRSASVVYAYMLYKNKDPIKAFEQLTSCRGVARPYKGFISEILTYFKVPDKDKILKELNSGLFQKPYRK